MAKLTRAQFKALPRNANGDIINLSEVFYLLKTSQVELLTSDDWSRWHEYHDELMYELAAYL